MGNPDNIIGNVKGSHCLVCGEMFVDMSETDSFVWKVGALKAAAAYNH